MRPPPCTLRRRRTLAALLMAAVTGACATPASVDGTWEASDAHQAGGLRLQLRVAGAGGAVSGQARRQVGALEAPWLAASGLWQAPELTLRWRGTDGGEWTLRARLVGPEQLDGTLHWPGGTTQAIRFVRP